ncbi:hypothetical protein EV424DRAFT_1555839 [Suillus variegatus]|nr:hypothetical protein EV424DRAFT_1555839 [Suillus variegatus]
MIQIQTLHVQRACADVSITAWSLEVAIASRKVTESEVVEMQHERRTRSCNDKGMQAKSTMIPMRLRLTRAGENRETFLTLLLPPPNPSSCVIIIQNNHIAEGGTINILSSNCNGSTVSKFEHVGLTAEPTSLDSPLMSQPEPTEYGRESIVLSGNTFGECVMINVGSPNCMGAVKQTALASRPCSRFGICLPKGNNELTMKK